LRKTTRTSISSVIRVNDRDRDAPRFETTLTQMSTGSFDEILEHSIDFDGVIDVLLERGPPLNRMRDLSLVDGAVIVTTGTFEERRSILTEERDEGIS